MASQLIAENLSKTYPSPGGELAVLRGVSLSLNAGESAAIMGPSGCGKSTLLNILGTLEPPTSGTLSICGSDPLGMNERDVAKFRNRRIGFIFQDHHLLPQCSVLENVLLPALAWSDNENVEQRATELIDRVGLSERLKHRPGELSGGERQRVAIARALVNRPGVVLADEPTGNLDTSTADVVADLLVELHRSEETVLVVVTHSPSLSERFDRRYDLDGGTLAART